MRASNGLETKDQFACHGLKTVALFINVRSAQRNLYKVCKFINVPSKWLEKSIFLGILDETTFHPA